MDLTIFEKLYWLGTTSEKGETPYVKYYAPFLYAVAGGTLMEMILQENISWKGKKELLGLIKNPPKDALLYAIWENCTIPKKVNWFWRSGKKQETAQTVADWLGMAIDRKIKLISQIISSLEDKKMIITEKKKFLGIFTYKSTHITSDQTRLNYQEKLQKIVSGEQEADLTDFIILKIASACKLYCLVYGGQFSLHKISLQEEIKKKLTLWAQQPSENEEITNTLKKIHLEKDLEDLTDALDTILDAIDGIADAIGDAGDSSGGDGDGGGGD